MSDHQQSPRDRAMKARSLPRTARKAAAHGQRVYPGWTNSRKPPKTR